MRRAQANQTLYANHSVLIGHSGRFEQESAFLWIHMRDEKRLRSYLLKPGKINEAGPDGLTALMFAAKCGWCTGVEVILAHNADVNAVGHPVDSVATTALSVAAFSGRTDVIEVLLSNRAHQGVGRPAIFEAARGNQLDACLYLLNAKVDVNATANSQTPLLVAAAAGYSEVCRLLLQHKADVDVVCLWHGQAVTPRQVALSEGKDQVVKLFRIQAPKAAAPDVSARHQMDLKTAEDTRRVANRRNEVESASMKARHDAGVKEQQFAIGSVVGVPLPVRLRKKSLLKRLPAVVVAKTKKWGNYRISRYALARACPLCLTIG